VTARVWRRARQEVIPFFAFSPEIRRVTYTTDAVESLNRAPAVPTATNHDPPVLAKRVETPWTQAPSMTAVSAIVGIRVWLENEGPRPPERAHRAAVPSRAIPMTLRGRPRPPVFWKESRATRWQCGFRASLPRASWIAGT
jgi:hypothetical protein